MLIKKKAEKVGDQIKFIDMENKELLQRNFKKVLHKCCVCNNEFLVEIDKKYIVKTQEFSMNITYYDAIDCPYCGSQNLVWKRLQKINKNSEKTNL